MLLLDVSIQGWIGEVFFVAASTSELATFVVVLTATAVFGLLVITTSLVVTFVALRVLFRVVFLIGVLLRLLLLFLIHTAHFDVVHIFL